MRKLLALASLLLPLMACTTTKGLEAGAPPPAPPRLAPVAPAAAPALDGPSFVPADVAGIPFLTYQSAAAGSPLYSPVSGQVVAEKLEGGDERSILIRSRQAYYLGGKEAVSEYELLVKNLKYEVKPETVEREAAIGVIAATTRLAARSRALDPYMLRNTTAKPVFKDGFWYFFPAWLDPSRFQALSFRQVDSFEAAVADFYERWAREDEKDDQSFATIHYFPELDRIRVKIKLDAYPVPANRTQALGMTELNFYRNPGLFVSESRFPMGGKYVPIMYWQKGFKEYLEKEYVLGNEVYVYCSVYTLDHVNKAIVVCVRDFALKSDEDVIAERRSEFEK